MTGRGAREVRSVLALGRPLGELVMGSIHDQDASDALLRTASRSVLDRGLRVTESEDEEGSLHQ